MSVILESQPGDKLVCIEGFSVSPPGEPFSWETCRTLKIGERVRYVSHYRDEHYKDNPVGWMVVFKTEDGKQYAATQTYFVTRDGWRQLDTYFWRHILRRVFTKPLRSLILKPLRSLRKRSSRPPLPPKG